MSYKQNRIAIYRRTLLVRSSNVTWLMNKRKKNRQYSPSGVSLKKVHQKTLLIKQSIHGCKVVLSWLKTVEDFSSKTIEVKRNYLRKPGSRLEGR